MGWVLGRPPAPAPAPPTCWQPSDTCVLNGTCTHFDGLGPAFSHCRTWCQKAGGTKIDNQTRERAPSGGEFFACTIHVVNTVVDFAVDFCGGFLVAVSHRFCSPKKFTPVFHHRVHRLSRRGVWTGEKITQQIHPKIHPRIHFRSHPVDNDDLRGDLLVDLFVLDGGFCGGKKIHLKNPPPVKNPRQKSTTKNPPPNPPHTHTHTPFFNLDT